MLMSYPYFLNNASARSACVIWGGGEPRGVGVALGVRLFSRVVVPIVGMVLEGLRYTTGRVAARGDTTGRDSAAREVSTGAADAAERGGGGGADVAPNSGADGAGSAEAIGGDVGWTGVEGTAPWDGDVVPDLLDFLDRMLITRLMEFVSRRRSDCGLSDTSPSLAMVVENRNQKALSRL